jgi:hypothetical protein
MRDFMKWKPTCRNNGKAAKSRKAGISNFKFGPAHFLFAFAEHRVFSKSLAGKYGSNCKHDLRKRSKTVAS